MGLMISGTCTKMKKSGTFLRALASLTFVVCNNFNPGAFDEIYAMHAEHSSESWIRCHMGAGDLLVLPAGIYHRFTLDMGNRVRTMRLFKVRSQSAFVFVF
jgi:hypothetical protein